MLPCEIDRERKILVFVILSVELPARRLKARVSQASHLSGKPVFAILIFLLGVRIWPKKIASKL
jgi:hypothetical protein